MKRQIGLPQARRWFAEGLRVTSPVRRNDSVVDAFATVPRERFLGPGPWRLLPSTFPDDEFLTPDDDPSWLYHDVLVVIDGKRRLNNGLPSLWARLLDQLDLKPGERVLQVGAGTGYYTALLAEMVGAEGRVIAIEHDRDLAERAEDNLQPWPQVRVINGDGTIHDPGKVDVIVAFAGATHPAPMWLDRLKPGGRLMMALTGDNGWGFTLKATRTASGFKAEALGSVGIFHCVGGRDAKAAKRLGQALRRLKGSLVPIRSLHRGKPPPAKKGEVWYAGPGFWLAASKGSSRSARPSARATRAAARPRKAGP
jgi:protein-L-isoaspartate(D-aspartate) O-methyltransferase